MAMFSAKVFCMALGVAWMAAAGRAAVPKVSIGPEGLRLEASGGAGNVLRVEAANDLAGGWQTLGAQVLTNGAARFADPLGAGTKRRFYRVTESARAEPERAPNFRLIDHSGRSHELHYYEEAEELKAFVLIFAANGCAELSQRWEALKALHARHATNGVKFWMINSNPADTRAALATEATRLATPIPILHDRAQTVARLYGIGQAAEAVVIRREGMGIVYRGALGAAGGSDLLQEGIEAALAGAFPPTLEARSLGCDLLSERAADLSYSTAIAPILQAKCVSCHSPGNVAPWAMTNHAVVKAYAELMLDAIASKEMPPWHADPEYGVFQNDISLSVEQERVLVEWLQAGAPRGTGPDPLENIPPPPPRWPAELGEPDMILRTPMQTIAADGVEPYRYIFVPTGLAADKWLRAAVVKPTNTRVVHHYLVWEGENMTQMAAGLAGYVPGMRDRGFPAGTGILLRAGSSVTFNLHYTPTGREETDQPELALWFHESKPAKELYTLPMLQQNFTIPAGARDHQVSQALIALPTAVTVYGFAPHMHLRGLRMRFDLVHPGGRRETLLNVPRYDFHWQTRYELATPISIPKGVRVEVVGGFDNSELNHHNPDPGAEVKWGEQSWEEMFIGYFSLTLN